MLLLFSPFCHHAQSQFDHTAMPLMFFCRISDLWLSNKCTLLLNEPFSWSSSRKHLKAKIHLTFSLATSYTAYKDEEESNCSSPHCGRSVQLRCADGGAAGTGTGMLPLSSLCLSWPASWWKGADTKSETAAPPGPAPALRINPRGPGMSIMPCGSHLWASDFSLSGLFVYAALGTWGARATPNDGWIKVQIKGKFKNRPMEASTNKFKKFQPPAKLRCITFYS